MDTRSRWPIGAGWICALVATALAACGGGDSRPANEVPFASFDLAPDSGAAPLTVSMDAGESSDRDGRINNFAWDFGDGSPRGSGTRAEHTFQSTGEYRVTLLVTDDRGAEAYTTRTIVVRSNRNPVPAFTVQPSPGIVPFRASFDAMASSDLDGKITAYAWDFGDGTTDSGRTVVHEYDRAGVYDVTLKVTDDLGATVVATKSVMAMSPVAANRYEVAIIPALDPAQRMEPKAINNRGQVVGRSYQAFSNAHTAFVYDQGVTRSLGTLGGSSSSADDINDEGEIVGYSDTAAGSRRAILYRDSAVIDLGTLGGSGSWASAINEAGSIVGASGDEAGVTRAFVYLNRDMWQVSFRDGTYPTIATAISEAGEIAGSYTAKDGRVHGLATYRGGTFSFGDDLDRVSVVAMNSEYWLVGMAVGVQDTAALNGFIDRVVLLQSAPRLLSVDYTEPFGMNEARVVVGRGAFHGEPLHSALVWDEVNGRRKLSDLVDPRLGWRFDYASSVNELGQILAYGSRSGGSGVAVILTPSWPTSEGQPVVLQADPSDFEVFGSSGIGHPTSTIDDHNWDFGVGDTGGSEANIGRRALVRFDMRALSGMTVHGATLCVFVSQSRRDQYPAPGQIDDVAPFLNPGLGETRVFNVADYGTPEGSDYHLPSIGNDPGALIGASQEPDAQVTLDVTAALQQALHENQPFVTFRIQTLQETDGDGLGDVWFFASADHPDREKRPRLEVRASE